MECPIRVILSQKQMNLSESIARRRTEESVRRLYDNNHGYSGDRFAIDLIGADGELALCVAMGFDWAESVNTFKLPDIGDDIQVRTTKYNSGHLIIRKADKPDELYVLVTGERPVFYIRGWIVGRDGMKQEWIKQYGDRPPAWFVPSSALNTDMTSFVCGEYDVYVPNMQK